MTEKQRLKPKNSSFLEFCASFDILIDPRGTKVVAIEITSKIALFAMILRSNIPVCIINMDTSGDPLGCQGVNFQPGGIAKTYIVVLIWRRKYSIENGQHNYTFVCRRMQIFAVCMI